MEDKEKQLKEAEKEIFSNLLNNFSVQPRKTEIEDKNSDK